MQCFCKKPGIFRVYPGLYRVYPKNTRFFCRSRFVCSHLPGEHQANTRLTPISQANTCYANTCSRCSNTSLNSRISF